MRTLFQNWENIGIAASIVVINLIIVNQVGVAYGRFDWMYYLGAYGIYGTNPVPSIASISPNAKTAGQPAFSLTATGSNFVNGAVVRWNGSARTTSFVNGSQLFATILASDIAAPGVGYVTVFNPAPGGGTSNKQALYITLTGTAVTASNTASGVNPSATTGAGGVTATATGTGTVSVAKYAGNPGGPPSFDSAGAYIDVHLEPGNTFTVLTIVDCYLNGGKLVYWWNGAAWVPASNQSYNASTHCVTVMVTNSTVPRLSDLTGSVFGAGLPYEIYLPLIEK